MYVKKSQNILEYTTLFCVVISALLIMQVYLKRAYQGRLKQEADNLGQQYSPKHTTSLTVANTTVSSVSYTGGTTDPSDLPGVITVAANVTDGINVIFSNTTTEVTRKEAVDSFATEEVW